MIRSFGNQAAKDIFEGRSTAKFRNIEVMAIRRLFALNAATSLESLRAVRSHNLEALKGDRKGQFSIRVNLQYRICFEWRGTDAFDVELVDYH